MKSSNGNHTSVRLIGTSDAIRFLDELIHRVGASDAPVLIQGESGTGKELVAQAIHERSRLAEFVPIDCGALPSNLAESELFGYEKGAFTGASDARTGLLEFADGGTAFFDEVGELPLDIQAKLLRVLQQREVRRLGSNRARSCNFRVIAATNRNLAEEVEQRRFRLDLFHRLNVVPLEIPPLRERKTDIPLLVEHFLRKTGRTYRYGHGLMDRLLEYRWPGNVRELQNCVARLVAFAAEDVLNAEDLHFPSPRQQAAEPSPQEEEQPVELSTVERHAVFRALASSNGNTTEAARALGISRTTLYRRRKQFGLTGSAVLAG
jgi:transcriptional regulator with GAF, ATPase, and Fis domain